MRFLPALLLSFQCVIENNRLINVADAATPENPSADRPIGPPGWM